MESAANALHYERKLAIAKGSESLCNRIKITVRQYANY